MSLVSADALRRKGTPSIPLLLPRLIFHEAGHTLRRLYGFVNWEDYLRRDRRGQRIMTLAMCGRRW